MPKKLPGISLEFIIANDDGDVVTGSIRAPAAALPIKAMRSVAKALKKMGGGLDPADQDHDEPGIKSGV